MSHTITRLSTAAVLCLSPIAFASPVPASEPAPDLGYARNGGIPYTEPDLGYARDGGIPYTEPDLGYARNGGIRYEEVDLGYARNGAVPYAAPDLGYARNGAVPYVAPDIGAARNQMPALAAGPGPAVVAPGLDAQTWTLLGTTGAAVVGLGLAGAFVVHRRHHPHLPHPV
jgi:hypothetical protein